MKGNKAAGDDGISAEEVKAAGDKGVDIIHKLCNQIWNSEVIPEDCGKAVIVPIFKTKDKMDLANYRGISLLSLAGKVFCTIIQTCIQQKTEETLSESQTGFRAGRSTVDQLFSLRQLAEKFTEIGSPLYCCYIDYQKAFDTVWQEGLWKAMEHLGYPSKIVRLLQALYKTSKTAVRVNQELTDWFPTQTGVRQGCILSPQLFNILLELVLRLSIEDVEVIIKIQGQIIHNLRFADDIVLLVSSENDLQLLVNKVQEWSKKFSLTINIGKTQVQVISKDNTKINIKIDDKVHEQVDSFIYLGGVITNMASSEGDIKRRIGLAMGIMQKLNSIWKSSEITTLTKLELYRVLVLSIATYGCETWTLKKKDEQRLLVFEMACLRKILGATRLDKVRNTAIREALNCHISIVNRVRVKQLTYFSHVKRVPSYRYPKITLEGIIPGKRPRGRPPMRWLDNIKTNCNFLGLHSVVEAGRVAQDRTLWKLLVARQLSPEPSRNVLGGQL